jgi:uncharacterized repeat protein (TIGR03803 family)
MNRPLFLVVFMIGCLFPSTLAQEWSVIDEADRVQLPGNAPLSVAPGSDIGRTNPDLRMQRMNVVLASSRRQGLAARHPELEQQLRAATSWLRSHGFAIELVRGSHSAIRFSGTVAQVEETFGVEIHTYVLNGKTYHGNATNPSIPRRLARLVLRVNGLDDFPVAKQTGSNRGFAVVHSFTGSAYTPEYLTVMDNAGNFYGATTGGGSAGFGTIFRLDSAGHETTLYNFTGTNGDGYAPAAGLVMDSAGNLYGTTEYGGFTSSNSCYQGCGTVFKLDPSGKETVLYSFTDTNGDGANPVAGLIMDSAGNLYGTTELGGSALYLGGTVFKLDPSGKETVLYSFTGANGDGAIPVAGLIMDSAGNLYGTTEYGGSGSCSGFSSGCGTVFKLDPSEKETVLYSFTSTNGDGANPAAGVIMDGADNLYGTTGHGGITSSSSCLSVSGCGTVFKLDPSGKETVLYSFTGTNGDGANPAAGVIMDSAGNLYGTAENGGQSSAQCPGYVEADVLFGCGTVFKLDPSGKETVLYSFTGTNGDGANPAAGLIMGSAGNLYGTTLVGGSAGGGTVFKLDSSSHETVFYSFTLTNGDGANPEAGLIVDKAGNFYGTTALGGLTGNCPPNFNIYRAVPTPAGCGTVFKLDPSGKQAVLYSFTRTNGDGANPAAGLIMDSAGNLYGTTAEGGSAGGGAAFKLNPSGNEALLYSFTGLTNGDGANPAAGLIMDSAGNLYGTTPIGGTSVHCPPPFEYPVPVTGCGTVFKLDPSGHETVPYSFTLTNGDGANPEAGLIMDSVGNLYGTTALGGLISNCIVDVTGPPPTPGCGTVFKLDPSGKETVLYSFTGTNGDGANPAAGVIMDSVGNLYGTTEYGGITTGSCSGPSPAGCGTVFKLDPSGKETVLYSFTGTNGDGANPVAGVITDSAGNLYGTTEFTAGSVGAGTVFKLDPSGKETVLYSFTGTNGDGAFPVASLIMDSAGKLYGTTEDGGSADLGTVFSLVPPIDFSFSPGSGGSSSATITAGQTATYNLQLNPAGGFSGTVSLVCSGAPAQATCSISPATLTVSGSSPAPFTVSITTMAATAMASTATGGSDSSSRGQRHAFLFAFLLLAAIGIGTRRSGGKRVWAPIGSLVCITIALVACGSSGSTGGSGGTPAGSYNLSIKGASQTISHTLTLTLTVK